MALELQYLGQNVSLFGPDMELTGDPAADNAELEKAGYFAGVPVKIVKSTTNPDGVAIKPIKGTELAADVQVFGVIITEPGEFANTIGPAGSNRIAVARAHFIGNLYSGNATQTTAAFNFVKPTSGTPSAFVEGGAIYLGDDGKWNNVAGATAASIGKVPMGICTHVPTTTEPWLGFASLV